MPLPNVDIQPDGDSRIALKLSAYHPQVVALVKSVPGATWAPDRQLWLVPKENTEKALGALMGVPHTMHPSLREAIVEATVARQVPADLSDWDELNYVPKVPSFEHQKLMVARAVRKKLFAFLAEMGTGKTKATIDTLTVHMMRQFVQAAIIFCPKAVLLNWKREWEKFSSLEPEARRLVVVSGSGTDKVRLLDYAYQTQAHVLVTNYATALNEECMRQMLHFIQDRKCAMVLDESTCIKNHKAKTTKGIMSVSPLCPVRIILTGTPITQGPLDAFSQFKFLDENILGHHDFYSFKSEYAIERQVRQNSRAKFIVGYKNLDRLAKRIEPWSVRVLKKDCLDIPEKMYRQLELEMSDDQALAYKQMKNQSVVEFENKTVVAPLMLTRMLRLQQIAAGFLPTTDEWGNDNGIITFKDTPKIQACREIVEEATADEKNPQKVIIWCRFIQEILALKVELDGFGVVVYYGDVGQEDRDKAVDSFNNDPNVRVFVGQVKTGGIGLNLVAATQVVYMTNPFSWEERAQSEDRAHRIGQKRTVTYTDLTCEGTIDTFVLNTLRGKKNVADVITGDNFREVLGL